MRSFEFYLAGFFIWLAGFMIYLNFINTGEFRFIDTLFFPLGWIIGVLLVDLLFILQKRRKKKEKAKRRNG